MLIASGCATAGSEPPHPTPDHPIQGCYISCASGRSFGARFQHLCQSDRFLLDIPITGEDNVPDDPSESRWFTGLTSTGADYTVRKRLKAESLKDGTVEWARRYQIVLKDVKREMGDEARAAYNKQDVVLMTCRRYIDQVCGGVDKKCGTHPGETLDGQSTPPRDH